MKTIGFVSIVILLLCLSTTTTPAQNVSNNLPVVIVKATDPSARWSGDPGRFVVLRDGPTNDALTIFFRLGGTAIHGVDYAQVATQFLLPAGARSNVVDIKPINHGQTVTKRVEFSLYQPPSFAPYNYRIGNMSNAVVTISPDPVPLRIVSPTNGASFPLGQPLTVCAQAMVTTTGYIATVEFFAGNLSLGICTNNPIIASAIQPLCVAWSNAPAGEHILTAKGTDNYGNIVAAEPVMVRVTQPELPTEVNIVAEDPVGAEGYLVTTDAPNGFLNPARFVVTRKGPTNLALTVFYRVSGTASNGVDYQLLPGTVTIPKGAFRANIDVLPINDQIREDTESVIIGIEEPLCAAVFPPPPGCYIVGPNRVAEAKILDDDPPVTTFVSIIAQDPEAAETALMNSTPTNPPINPAVFLVSRAGPTNIPLTVYYSVGGTASNGVDYRLISGSLTIPVGTFKAAIEIMPIDDQMAEQTENVVVELRPPACPAIYPPPPECYQLTPTNRAVAFILDNDKAPTNQPPIVRITAPPNGAVFRSPVNIPIYAFARDYDGAVAKVEFFTGTSLLGSGVNPAQGTDNNLVVSNTFMLVWSNAPVGGHLLTAVATDNLGAVRKSEPVTIKVTAPEPPVTNRPVVITVAATDPLAIEGTNCWVRPVRPEPTLTWSNWFTGSQWTYVTNCGPKNAAFTIRRAGDTNQPVIVFYTVWGSASNGVDYVKLTGTATVPAGARTAIVPVVPIPDEIFERNETVVLRLLPSPSAAPMSYFLGYPRSAAVTIMDSMRPWPLAGVTPDHLFHLRASGPDGAWFRVEYSTNLAHWLPVCTNQVVNGSVDFLDPDAADSGVRFYRAVPESNEPQ